MSASWEMARWEGKETDTAIHDAVPPAQGGRTNSTPTTLKDTANNDDYDDAADIFADTAEMFHYTEEEANRVRWKVDLILLPAVCSISGVFQVPTC
jgi:hypothetical protein